MEGPRVRGFQGSRVAESDQHPAANSLQSKPLKGQKSDTEAFLDVLQGCNLLGKLFIGGFQMLNFFLSVFMLFYHLMRMGSEDGKEADNNDPGTHFSQIRTEYMAEKSDINLGKYPENRIDDPINNGDTDGDDDNFL